MRVPAISAVSMGGLPEVKEPGKEPGSIWAVAEALLIMYGKLLCSLLLVWKLASAQDTCKNSFFFWCAVSGFLPPRLPWRGDSLLHYRNEWARRKAHLPL